MSAQPLADHDHRQRALDTTASFIVQAPAGSGKTELLTLRFLKLLLTCEQPEQVLAITFTRKAANEMSRRIAEALRWTTNCIDNQIEPECELERQRFDIVRQVLARDAQYNWHLLQNPARLRVQTIDSFCFYLANQLPVLSQLGGNPQVSEDATPCFIDAISNTLAQLESDLPVSDDIATLLMHLDNDLGKVERLLVSLLHKREQWLSHILEIRHSFADARIYLQQSLAELVTESLAAARASLQPYESRLVPLLNFAADNLSQAGKLQIADYAPLISIPDATAAAMPYWQFLVALTLKASAEPAWRKQVNVANGFPSGDKSDKARLALYKSQKEAMHALLETFATDADLLAALDYVRMLPDPALNPESWQFLAALTRVLAHLSTELLLSFRKFRVIDYAHTSSAARTALGDEDTPTDLALALDHRIQHVLVDEFQDTSQMQLEILRQITACWEPADGRTLFLVGDAMQSCYAFRNANVGIYLQVRANGLGNVPLIPLTLATNFRSQERVVSWVNQVFASAFPQQSNISCGAVPYTHSVAVHQGVADEQVQVFLLPHEREQQELARKTEADLVVARIKHLQQKYPEQSIAILVRARAHLLHIIPALRAADIQWRSTDIDHLATLPVIADLLSLTRALLNQADRLAWLAVLRAPWCGLTINALHAVSSHAGKNSIWSALQNLDAIDSLEPDARERLQGILSVFDFAMRNRIRVSLSTLLEQCWHLLGGVTIARDALELESVTQFLQLVSGHEVGCGIPDIDQFSDTVAAAFVPNRVTQESQARTPIQLLTMHKAKGLEFDHVLLPGLARAPKTADKPLLQWHQRLNQAGASRLFLATLSAAGTDSNPLYQLLRHEQHYKTMLENTRLLYIAVTRARTSVQLFATLARNVKGDIKPAESSLLSRIWRELNTALNLFTAIQLSESVTDTRLKRQYTDYPAATSLRRLRAPLQLSGAQLQRLSSASDGVMESVPAVFTLQVEAAVGTIIHRSLEAIGRSGNYALDSARLRSMRQNWLLQLRNLVAASELTRQVQLVETGVIGTLQNTALRWLFDNAAGPAEFELDLTRRRGIDICQFKIDRIAMDAAGRRWVIDYKTAAPRPGQAEADFFVEQQQLYGAQLQNYAALISELEQQPVKSALLFTTLGKLLEIT
ncbi:MAG: hypothetical protein EXR84_09200 [Gammaproteobacteria bacterium]|nr:hypothetical protein [Gammaproteobacteria bacterium]